MQYLPDQTIYIGRVVFENQLWIASCVVEDDGNEGSSRGLRVHFSMCAPFSLEKMDSFGEGGSIIVVCSTLMRRSGGTLPKYHCDAITRRAFAGHRTHQM